MLVSFLVLFRPSPKQTYCLVMFEAPLPGQKDLSLHEYKYVDATYHTKIRWAMTSELCLEGRNDTRETSDTSAYSMTYSRIYPKAYRHLDGGVSHRSIPRTQETEPDTSSYEIRCRCYECISVGVSHREVQLQTTDRRIVRRYVGRAPGASA